MPVCYVLHVNFFYQSNLRSDLKLADFVMSAYVCVDSKNRQVYNIL